MLVSHSTREKTQIFNCAEEVVQNFRYFKMRGIIMPYWKGHDTLEKSQLLERATTFQESSKYS